jgi:RHS repeat-associated protein
VTWLDANFTAKSNTDFAWNRTFTGQVLDAETGLMLYRDRYYSTKLGRFITRDPIEYEANDTNLMRYTFTNPIRFVDPFGHTGYCETVVNIEGKISSIGRPYVDSFLHRNHPEVLAAKNALENVFSVGGTYKRTLIQRFPRNPKDCPPGKVYKTVKWLNGNDINFAPVPLQSSRTFTQCADVTIGTRTVIVCIRVTVKGRIETNKTCYTCQCP